MIIRTIADDTLLEIKESLPEGSFTIQEISDLSGYSRPTANAALDRFLTEGYLTRIDRLKVKNLDSGETYVINKKDRIRRETLIRLMPSLYQRSK